jgi:hypothetical protein
METGLACMKVLPQHLFALGAATKPTRDHNQESQFPERLNQPQRWRQYVSLKCWYLPTNPQSVTTQKNAINFITMRNSNFTFCIYPLMNGILINSMAITTFINFNV